MSVWDMYRKLDGADVPAMIPCPVCGRRPAMWRYSESETAPAPASKVVMCEYGDDEEEGPRKGLTNNGCLLYMPPDDFYKPTMREAAQYWNAVAAHFTKMRQN